MVPRTEASPPMLHARTERSGEAYGEAGAAVVVVVVVVVVVAAVGSVGGAWSSWPLASSMSTTAGCPAGQGSWAVYGCQSRPCTLPVVSATRTDCTGPNVLAVWLQVSSGMASIPSSSTGGSTLGRQPNRATQKRPYGPPAA